MRRRWPGFLAIGGVLLCLGLLAAPRQPVRAAAAQVTWRGQVAPLLYANCTACHHQGGSAPFSLMTFAEARRWGPQIAEVVQSRYMPPWLPEATGGPQAVHFLGDRHLSPAQIETLTAWANNGMPEGSGAVPHAPDYPAEWQLGKPDLVLEMPEPVTEPASGSDMFVNFVLPAAVQQTRWIRAMEIKPGAGSLVHHANVILDRKGSLRWQHPGDWQRGIAGMDLEIDSGDMFDPDSHFLFWKPDSTALVEPASMPWRLDPGNDLILNMHLKPTGKPEQVRARIGLYFAEKPATAHPMLLEMQHDALLAIPAGAANFVVTDELKLPVGVDLLGVYPHAHYLGHQMEGWATLPDGQNQPFLRISNWDIDRQAVYQLEKPLALPAGTVLHMRYSYDNSAENVHNPASPPVAVRAGNRAVDEMGHLWLQVLPHDTGAGDPRLPLEQAWMESALAKSPGDTVALYNLGAVAQMEGKPDVAAASFRRLLVEHPADARALTSLGTALETEGDLPGARRQFEAALTANPGYADAAFDLGSLELQAGETAAAEGHLRKVLALQPEDAEAHRLLATMYAGQGDAGRALGELAAWARATPGRPEAHRALAQVLSATGQAERALAEQHIVVGMARENAGDWNDLGAMEARAGHLGEARAAFAEALRLEPGNQAAQANLAKVGAGTGR